MSFELIHHAGQKLHHVGFIVASNISNTKVSPSYILASWRDHLQLRFSVVEAS